MRTISTACAVFLVATIAAPAQQKPAADPAKIEAMTKAAWSRAAPDWQARLEPDLTMKECVAHDNHPPKPLAEAIQKREKATIEYPADGKLMGDWKKGEALAQSGYGLRFSDYPPQRANGGNCYACHQLTKQELSYGTIGPSLLQYGKLHEFKEEAVKATYERIYNSHASHPCSFMPRFGANKVLTIDQIKDAVALLMSPDSPVNK